MAPSSLPPAMRALLGKRPHLPLKEIASRWASELDVTYSWLAASLANFVLSDDDNGDDRVLVWDETDLTISQIKASDLRANILRLAHKTGRSFDQVAALSIKRNWIFLRRETVWEFCRSHNLRPPSFWPFPRAAAQSGRPGNILARLAAFHLGRAKETEAMARAAADTDPEIGGKFTDRQWRKAWRDRDPETKYLRGHGPGKKPK
jgi:hypothetical protein